MGLFGNAIAAVSGGKLVSKTLIIDILRQSVEKNETYFVKCPFFHFERFAKKNAEIGLYVEGFISCHIVLDGTKTRFEFQVSKTASEPEETIVRTNVKYDPGNRVGFGRIEEIASDIAEILTTDVTSNNMAKSLAYSLICETTILTQENLRAKFELPYQIESFLLKCSDNLTQFDAGYMSALAKNLNRDEFLKGEFDDEIEVPCNKFKDLRSGLHDPELKHYLSCLVILKIIEKWDL